MIKIAVLGLGNIGRAVLAAIEMAQDMQLARVYHHNETESLIADAKEGKVDVVALCVPSREVPNVAVQLLKEGISTVDSFDIHTEIVSVRRQLLAVAREHQAVSVLSAGWDPGTDSVVRCLMQAMAPQGLTFTNFGPGRSMGHTVAVKAIRGVKDAISMTMPMGYGVHRRMVYVELEEGADFQTIEQIIKQDAYFIHDETIVSQVPSVAALNNVAHGVHLVRNGVSGATHNQQMEFNMAIDNPALTGQVLVSSARAAMRLKTDQRFGCFTLPEVPPVFLLPGEEEQVIAALV